MVSIRGKIFYGGGTFVVMNYVAVQIIEVRKFEHIGCRGH